MYLGTCQTHVIEVLQKYLTAIKKKFSHRLLIGFKMVLSPMLLSYISASKNS